MSSLILFVILGRAALAANSPHSAAIKLDVWGPTQNATDAGPLSPYLVGFSLEPTFASDFLGNDSTGPNELIIDLLTEIEQRVGGLGIRIGGATADSSVWNASVQDTVRDADAATGAIFGTEIGPGFFEAFKWLPESTVFNMNLNLGNYSYANALAEARAAQQYLGSQLTSFSIGNEPDIYKDYQRNLSTWDKDSYYVQWTVWAHNLTQELGLHDNFFRCGEWSHTPISYATPNATIRQADVSPQDMIDRGVTALNVVEDYSFHFYPESSCNPTLAKGVKLSTLVNHAHTVAFINKWAPQVQVVRSVGSEVVFGEWNSVSCAGGANVSSTFGTGLWITDIILYSASVGVKGMYAHNGGTLISAHASTQSNSPGLSWYDFAYPYSSERNGPARATSIYPGFLLAAEALGPCPEKSLIAYQPLPDMPDIGAYIIWDSSVRDPSDGPARIVMVNFGNNTSTFDLSQYDPKEVKRLTGPDLSSTNSSQVYWAGQNYMTGQPTGDRQSDPVTDGTVTLNPTEAILVCLCQWCNQ